VFSNVNQFEPSLKVARIAEADPEEPLTGLRPSAWLLALLTNIRQGREWLALTSLLAYNIAVFEDCKSFITQVKYQS